MMVSMWMKMRTQTCKAMDKVIRCDLEIQMCCEYRAKTHHKMNTWQLEGKQGRYINAWPQLLHHNTPNPPHTK